MLRLERYKAMISRSDPLSLEGMVRGLLVHYFFHVSEKRIVEIVSEFPGIHRTVNLLTPTVLKGRGKIRLGPRTIFGVIASPGSYGCSYIEARTEKSFIDIGDQTVINNRAIILSEGAGITIGKRCLIGYELQVLDTNAHELAVERRQMPDQNPLPVVIGDDVFIGGRVTILKGCRIGDGSAISAGCVLPPLFEAPPRSIVAGNPARIVGQVVPDANGGLPDPARN